MALVLEAVPDGICLRQWMGINKMTLEQFYKIAIGITEGLKAIHQADIIHKDIKPDNVIISRDLSHIKLIDFGVSVQVSRETPNERLTKKLCGSLPYIAPEQTGATNDFIDYRVDFYSLGCTFYEMLTSKTPFDGSTLWEWINLHTQTDPEPLYQIDDTIPISLSDLVEKLLAKKPHDRYQSSFGICNDLLFMQKNIDDTESLDNFQIAENDVSDKFIISNEIYGRAKEIESFLEQIHSEDKKCSIFTINGYSGIGKTAFVQAIRTRLSLNRINFSYGKFEQYNNNSPYQAIGQAVDRFINDSITSNEYLKISWSKRIKEELGDDINLLADLLPSLLKLNLDTVVSSKLITSENQYLFYSTLFKLLNIISSKDKRLVLCLDDMQWADVPSVKLISKIVFDSEINYLPIILTYRSNQLAQSYTFSKLLQDFDQAGRRVDINLSNLSEDDIDKIVKDTLHVDDERSLPLSKIIYRKSAGNPYFAKSLLTALYHDKLINFSYEQGVWTYDLNLIEDYPVSEDIALFMSERMSKLSSPAKTMLSIASCIGTKFNAQTLSSVTNIPLYEIIETLKEPIEKNIIDIYSGEYNLYSKDSSKNPTDEVTVKFIHDKTQQAAYNFLSKKQRLNLHYQIAKCLMEDLYNNKCNSISVAYHLNESLELITNENEKIEAARINLRAGLRSLRSNAYESAYHFLSTALEFLPKDCWKTQYRLTWDIHYYLINSAHLAANYDNYRSLLEDAITHSQKKIERAQLLRMKMLSEIVHSDYEDAVMTGLSGLALFGVNIKKQPSKFRVIQLLLTIKFKANKINLEDIMSKNLIKDVDHKMVMTLISEMLTAAYYLSEKANQSLFPALVMRGVLYSLEHGMTKESGYLFEVLSVLFSALLKDYKKAKDLGILGKQWLDKYHFTPDLCRTQFVYSIFTIPWNEPLQNVMPALEQAIEFGLMNADQQYLSYCAFHLSLYDPMLPFKERTTIAKDQIALIDKTKHFAALYIARFINHYWRNLSGEYQSSLKVNSSDFSEDEYLDYMQSKEVHIALAIYHQLKMQICFYHRDFSKARLHINQLEKYRSLILGMPLNIDLSLFKFLCISNSYQQKNHYQKLIDRIQLSRELRQMKIWYKYNPNHFAPMYWLMMAEWAKITGAKAKAKHCYEQATQSAKNLKYLRYDSLICEQYGRYLLDLKDPNFTLEGIDYLKQAMVLNNRLGCEIKHNQIKKLLMFSDSSNDNFLTKHVLGKNTTDSKKTTRE